MPDPISSSNANQSTSPTYDPYSDEVGKVSRADAPNSSQAAPEALGSPAVPVLINSVRPPASALPPPAPSAPPSAANNNAQRTTERHGVAPYAAAGKAAAGDSGYAGVALVKGRDPKTGLEAEVLSASVQVGAQNEVQVGLVRVGGSVGMLSGSVEAMTARANAGIHNDDGSTGFNVGAGATLIGSEATVGSANGLTFGLAASVGAGASVGGRDLDADGRAELCARVSYGPLTVGLCLESPL